MLGHPTPQSSELPGSKREGSNSASENKNGVRLPADVPPRLLVIVLIVIVATRLVSLPASALIDPSDARYTHIAEHMVRQGEWLSPMVHQGNEVHSYWSKPPLGFWMMAVSMSIFGVSEFAARLPIFLASVATAMLTGAFNAKLFGTRAGLLSSVFYLSTPFVLVMAGGALVDPLLSFFITGAVVGFGLILLDKIDNRKTCAAFSYSCVGLGIMTKGPIAAVIPALSVTLFLALSGKPLAVKKLIPLVGTVIVLTLVLPWFILMEQEHPGFTRYFLLDENLRRLTSSSLKLQSGSAHRTFFGFALLMFPLVGLPWIVFLGSVDRKSWFETIKPHLRNPVFLFLISWIIGPLFLLSVGQQVLIYYLLPLIPALCSFLVFWVCATTETYATLRYLFASRGVYQLSLLLTVLMSSFVLFYEHHDHVETLPEVVYLTVGLGLCQIIASYLCRVHMVHPTLKAALSLALTTTLLLVGTAEPLAERNSSAALFLYLKTKVGVGSQERLFFFYEAPPSSYFYSQHWLGEERFITTVSQENFKNEIDEGILVTRDKNFIKLPFAVKQRPVVKVGKWFIQQIESDVLEAIRRDTVDTHSGEGQ